MWEKFPIQDPVFCGLGERPAEFPEIELTYDTDTAGRRRHAATAATRRPAPPTTRCSTARTSSRWPAPIRAMRRSSRRCSTGACACVRTRFPKSAPPASTTSCSCPRTCRGLSSTPTARRARSAGGWGERLDLDIPFFVAGFDAASEELKVPIDRGVVAAGAAYLGATRSGPNAPWLQLCEPGRDAPSHDAAGVVYRVGERWHPMPTARALSRANPRPSPRLTPWSGGRDRLRARARLRPAGARRHGRSRR